MLSFCKILESFLGLTGYRFRGSYYETLSQQGRTKMKITSVKINLLPDEDKIKAYASIVIDDCFIVHDLKIIRTDDKFFVAMPSKKDKAKDMFQDVAHPLNKKTRKAIQKAIFKQYEKSLVKFQKEEEFFNSYQDEDIEENFDSHPSDEDTDENFGSHPIDEDTEESFGSYQAGEDT